MRLLGNCDVAILDHLLNQVDGFGGQPGTTAVVAGFEFPEEPKPMTMPAQQGGWLEDRQCFFPVLDPNGGEDEPEVIQLDEAWLLDLPMKNNQLLPEQGILDDEFSFASKEVRGAGEYDRIPGRLGKAQENPFESSKQVEDKLDK